jgi:hypothetical protein
MKKRRPKKSLRYGEVRDFVDSIKTVPAGSKRHCRTCFCHLAEHPEVQKILEVARQLIAAKTTVENLRRTFG